MQSSIKHNEIPTETKRGSGHYTEQFCLYNIEVFISHLFIYRFEQHLVWVLLYTAVSVEQFNFIFSGGFVHLPHWADMLCVHTLYNI